MTTQVVVGPKGRIAVSVAALWPLVAVISGTQSALAGGALPARTGALAPGAGKCRAPATARF